LIKEVASIRIHENNTMADCLRLEKIINMQIDNFASNTLFPKKIVSQPLAPLTFHLKTFPSENRNALSPNNCQSDRHQSTFPPPPNEQCQTCLVTGVLTCTAVSSYLFKMALLDLPVSTKREVLRQKRFLLGFGSAWAVAGAYRLYLG